MGGEADFVRARGADYVDVGPLFRTSADGAAEALGLDRFIALARAADCPVVAIGGIDAENAGAVMRAGASGVAVFSAILGAPDPMPRARALRAVLDASGR